MSERIHDNTIMGVSSAKEILPQRILPDLYPLFLFHQRCQQEVSSVSNRCGTESRISPAVTLASRVIGSPFLSGFSHFPNKPLVLI